MIGKEKLDRINELANKKKAEGLTPEETAEQEVLRKEYVEAFRAYFRGHLSQVKFVEDLSEEELAEINKNKQQ